MNSSVDDIEYYYLNRRDVVEHAVDATDLVDAADLVDATDLDESDVDESYSEGERDEVGPDDATPACRWCDLSLERHVVPLAPVPFSAMLDRANDGDLLAALSEKTWGGRVGPAMPVDDALACAVHRELDMRGVEYAASSFGGGACRLCSARDYCAECDLPYL